jgi:hypothetical protein
MTLVTDQPFHESFLERIVGVNWAGGSGAVFVSGDLCCFQRCCTLEQRDSRQSWVAVGDLAFGPGGGTTASSYGLTLRDGPMFLVGGHSGESNPILMRSRDGIKWENIGVAHLMAQRNIDKLVWDAEENLFYLQGDGEGTRPFYSPDGLYWFYSYSEFETHCKGPLSGVADGVYGFDPAQNLIITPDGNGGVVAIVGKKTIPILVGLDQCNCIAYAGGVWMAGGRAIAVIPTNRMASVTTSSIDGGNTWVVSTYGDLNMPGLGDPGPGFEITTMVAGPIQDFKRK